MNFWRGYCRKMEIKREEGNTMQINTPERCLKPSKKGTAEIVLQRHPEPTQDFVSAAAEVCGYAISEHCKSCYVSPPSHPSPPNSKRTPIVGAVKLHNHEHSSEKNPGPDKLSFTRCVSSLHRPGATREQRQHRAAGLLTPCWKRAR